MRIVTNLSPTPSGLPGIDHSTLAGSEHGLRQLSVWQQVLQPGGATPPHRHDCEEVVLCSAGRGRITLDGQEPQEFGPSMTVCIPKNALHEIVNVGDEPMHIVAIFGTAPVVAHFPDGAEIPLPWKS
jgi:quercetin dioxygenase-like cupin family protein